MISNSDFLLSSTCIGGTISSKITKTFKYSLGGIFIECLLFSKHFLKRRKLRRSKKRQSEGGGTPSKSKYMPRAKVKELFTKEKAFNEGASKAIFEGLKDYAANCSSNTSAAQKKVTIASTGTSMLNKITKLRPGAKGDNSP